MQAVIYIFRCPKGRVYVGRRTVSPEALRCWPGQGINRLPDGYAGSGKAWQSIHRRHGRMCIWRIVARVEGGRDAVNRAERRAIHLARLIFGPKCVNILSGGEGLTSEEARALHADPAVKERHKAGAREAQNRPEVKAKQRIDPSIRARRAVAAAARPEVKAKQRSVAKEVSARPEVIAKRVTVGRALARTPERKAHLDRARQINNRKRRARKALAPFTISPAVSLPGATVWIHRPGLTLGISGPFHNKGKA